MQNDTNSPKETDTTIPTVSTQKNSICLFSQEEVTSIVKDFITAWIRGDVDFEFANMMELVERAKVMGKKIDYAQAEIEEGKEKDNLTNLVLICSGDVAATPEQRQKAIHDVFRTIMSLRLGHRLKGTFFGTQIENKVIGLEESIKELNRHFEELYFYVKTKIPDDTVLGKR